MRYPIAIETGDAKHAFGAVVPDLPGCFSAGDTLDDALTNAREAILLHLEGLLDDGKAFPAPTPIQQLQKKRSYHGWTWAVVDATSASSETKPRGSTSRYRGVSYGQSMPTPESKVRPDPGLSPAQPWTQCASRHEPPRNARVPDRPLSKN